jgi:hypothetical protein
MISSLLKRALTSCQGAGRAFFAGNKGEEAVFIKAGRVFRKERIFVNLRPEYMVLSQIGGQYIQTYPTCLSYSRASKI